MNDDSDRLSGGTSGGASNGAPLPDEPRPAATESTDPGTTSPAEDDELARAARAAQVEHPTRSEPATGQPRSFLILTLVVFCILGMGVYGIVWWRNMNENNARIRWQSLEQQLADYQAQERFVAQQGYRPAGKEIKPLTKTEQAELAASRQRFGSYTPTPKSFGPPGATTASPPTTAPTPTDGNTEGTEGTEQRGENEDGG